MFRKHMATREPTQKIFESCCCGINLSNFLDLMKYVPCRDASRVENSEMQKSLVSDQFLRLVIHILLIVAPVHRRDL